jgi:hypothetical protein
LLIFVLSRRRVGRLKTKDAASARLTRGDALRHPLECQWVVAVLKSQHHM